MTSVSLARLWINRADDLTDARAFFTAAWLVDSPSIPIEVRSYAGGRRRAISRAGQDRTFSLTLRNVTADDIAWLEAGMGLTVLVRDQIGRKAYGVYGSVESTPYRDRSAFDAGLSVQQVTHPEAV